MVGVAAKGFSYPIRSRPVQIWTTLARDASSATVQPITEQRGNRLLDAVARLSAATPLEQAQARLDAVAAQLAAAHPDTHKNLPATYVRPELERLLGPAREPILILWGAVALVLLIACANIANMLLARTADRQHELGVRMAIGGSRGRIVRQLLTENLTIAMTGALVGVAGAIVIVRALVSLTADYLPRATDMQVDGGVLAFTVAIALAVTVLVSVPPALLIGKGALGQSMGGGSRAVTGAHERVRGALVVAQVSVGLILLCGASILAAGFLHLTQRDLGFRPEDLLTFRIELPGVRYSTDRQIEFIDGLLERLTLVPGVTSATAGMPLPLTGNEMSISFNIEERPAGPSERPSSNMAIVSPGYFRTIGTPILMGRDFTDEDDERHPRVLVVNKAFAERFFPGENAIGKRIASGAISNRDPRGATIFREIVGITGNARQSTGGREPDPIYYLPIQANAVGAAVGDRARDAPGGDHRAGDAPNRRRARSASAGAWRHDDECNHVARHGGASTSDTVDEQLRGHWSAADGNRLVRSALLRRIQAHAGNRRAHGPGGQPAQHRVADSGTRDDAHRDWHSARWRRHACRTGRAEAHALRSRRATSAGVAVRRRGDRRSHGGRSRVPAGDARRFDRSDHGAAGGMSTVRNWGTGELGNWGTLAGEPSSPGFAILANAPTRFTPLRAQ